MFCEWLCVVIFILFLFFFLTISFCLKYGMTALHYAAFNGFEQIVKILVEHRSNINIQDKVFFFFFFFFLISLCCNTVDLLDCVGWVGGMRGWWRGWWRGLEWFFWNFLFLFFFIVLGWENSPWYCKRSKCCWINHPIEGFLFISHSSFFFDIFLISFNFFDFIFGWSWIIIECGNECYLIFFFFWL